MPCLFYGEGVGPANVAGVGGQGKRTLAPAYADKIAVIPLNNW